LIHLWDAVVKIIIYICLFSNILFLLSFGYTLQLKNILHIHQGINSGLPHQLILYHPLILHFISQNPCQKRVHILHDFRVLFVTIPSRIRLEGDFPPGEIVARQGDSPFQFLDGGGELIKCGLGAWLV
jgi:hypothetical protein